MLHGLTGEQGSNPMETHVVTGVWQWYWVGGVFKKFIQQELLEEPARSTFMQVLDLAARPSPGIHTLYVVNRHSGTLHPEDLYISRIKVGRQLKLTDV